MNSLPRALPLAVIVILGSSFAACSERSDTQSAVRDHAVVNPHGDVSPDELEAIRVFLSERITTELERKEIASIAIGLYTDEGVLWTDGFGIEAPASNTNDADSNNKDSRGGAAATVRQASRSTVYRVGSVSKLFTDIAVMQRVEAGDLDLDAPITDYLPEFRPHNPFDAPITLRQLMCHRAGLVREPPIGNYFDDTEPSLAETVASLNATQLVHQPGTVTKYSNAGIAVVGHVLAQVSGVPFEDAVRAAVLDPLGMFTSDFLPSTRVAGRVATAEMRTYDRRRFEAPKFQLGMSPAGSLYSTIDDLALFTGALLRGGSLANKPEPDGSPAASVSDDRLLSTTSLAEMFTPQFADEGAATGYGLGFRVDTLKPGNDSASEPVRRLGHGGAIYGFSTQLGFLPDHALGVAVTSSLDQSNGLISQIANQALEALLIAKRHDSGDGALRDFLANANGAPTAIPTPDQIRRLAGSYLSPEGAFDLLARPNSAGDLRLLLSTGTAVHEVAVTHSADIVDGSGLAIDGLSGRGGHLNIVDPDSGPDSTVRLRRGEQEYTQSAVRIAPPAPDRLRPALGKYGWEHNPLYLFEREGELWALIEWLEVTRLREIGPATDRPQRFAIDTGMYVGEELTLEWDAQGAVSTALLGPVAFERKTGGLAAGDTFRIDPIRSIDELRAAALAASPPKEERPAGGTSSGGTETATFRDSDLVELTALDPNIQLDIRYATTNNFMSSVFYKQPRAFLQRAAADALVRAHLKLREQGYGLLIHDAYRPWYVTKMFWDATPEDKKIFVADPSNGSRHNRGCAVDLTLIDLATGQPVQMVGGYDEMTDRSFPDTLDGTARQRSLRELLRTAMEAEGFAVYEFEWWHFDYQDWRSFRIENRTFDQL